MHNQDERFTEGASDFEPNFGRSSADAEGEAYAVYYEDDVVDLGYDPTAGDHDDADMPFTDPLQGLLSIAKGQRRSMLIAALARRMGGDLESAVRRRRFSFYCSELNPISDYSKLYPVDLEIGRLPFPILVPERLRTDVAFFYTTKSSVELTVARGELVAIGPYRNEAPTIP
jgi:hypothetical protein